MPDYRLTGEDELLRDVPEEQIRDASQRCGALLIAANMVFERVLDDIAVMASVQPRTSEEGERFVDEFFAPWYRHLSRLTKIMNTRL